VPYSFVQYTLGSPTVGPFTVSFPYIEKYQVEVRKNGVLLTVTTDYTWPTANTVQLNVAGATNDLIEVRRNSLRKADGTVGRIVDFTNSAKLTESNLDRDSLQCFYLAQEAFDSAANALQLATTGVYDALNRRLTNVANGVDPQDAVTMAQLTAAILGGVTPTAANITNVPSGNLAAANVQAALNELQTDVDTRATSASVTASLAAYALKGTAQTFTAAQRGTVSALTSGTTITPDFAVANNFSLSLGHNATLANPTNLTAGQSGVITITNTGTFTLAYGSNWKPEGGSVPSLTSTASSVDVLAYYVESATRITFRLIKDTK